ncbi:MAG: T9SS type A sorting domain-containing protein [Duncaniella sp.]|nr:T9SS type A sorting domain-containing protein [Duncaniella sp.]
MKKLYSLMAMAVLTVMGSHAADLKFWIGDTEIENGKTITYSTLTSDDLGGLYEIKMAPELFVSSDEATSVTIIAACTSGQDIQMCAGGQCSSGKTVTKTASVNANEKLPLIFDWIDYVEDLSAPVPAVTTNFTATAGSVTRKFTLVMDPAASSLKLVETTNTVTYGREGLSFDVASPSTLSLYSITGTQVLSQRVDGQGTVNTHSLRPGVYIYALRGARNVTGKILVK